MSPKNTKKETLKMENSIKLKLKTDGHISHCDLAIVVGEKQYIRVI